MTRSPVDLPQLAAEVFLTDSGLETDLIFNHGVELPDFAAYPLVADERGVALLRAYYADHLAVAAAAGVGLVLETPTWRANGDWGARLGHDAVALDELNRLAVAQLVALRDESRHPWPLVISGCLGPRGDGYHPGAAQSASAAHRYHQAQVDSFAGTDADVVTALTLTYPAEAIGVARAAQQAGVPVVVSFTVETDGALPDGTALGDAIRAVDEATGAYPAYYMINCAHPTHFAGVLDPAADWLPRLRGICANASPRSHAELDAAPELDAGDPALLGRQYAELRRAFPGLTVLGGCCGTDVRHIREIAAACVPARSAVRPG
jgi:homocysteine S-methyltransferase